MSTWHFVLRKTASRKEQYLQALGGAPDFMLSMQEEKRILHASLPLEHRTLPKLEWKNKQTKDKKVKKKKKEEKCYSLQFSRTQLLDTEVPILSHIVHFTQHQCQVPISAGLNGPHQERTQFFSCCLAKKLIVTNKIMTEKKKKFL